MAILMRLTDYREISHNVASVPYDVPDFTFIAPYLGNSGQKNRKMSELHRTAGATLLTKFVRL